MRPLAVLFALVLFTSTALSAQWLNQPTPGIPRTSDGKPNLTASAPRAPDGRPDLSGLWRIDAGTGYDVNIVADLKPAEIQPWAQTLYRQRVESFEKDDPVVQCLPRGPRAFFSGGLARFVHTRALLAILFEELTYRQVFIDGRALEADPNPSWMGHSVGHWEGDTLVVESTGFNERSWLDDAGHSHTESLRITERLRRRDFGHIDMQVTFADPKAYGRPWTISFVANLVPDTEPLEEVCNETPRDHYHISGGSAAKRTVFVSLEILEKYVGTYEVRSASNVVTAVYVVKLSDGRLWLDVDGVGNLMMVPLSETTFAPPMGGSYEFVTDAQGAVSEMRLHGVSGMRTAVRRR
jgi:hypothetical protein